MRRVRYGVGVSLDGFIADDKGGTDFLVSDPTYDPAPFFASIDAVLMGRVTYEGAVRQGMRAYPGLTNYVVSRTMRPPDYPEVTILSQDVESFIAKLKRKPGKDIWLCGGGVLFGSLLAADLVDTVELGVSPLLLGCSGTPMLAIDQAIPQYVRLDLTRHAALPSGLLILEYAVRHRSPQAGRQLADSKKRKRPRRPARN
jgi:dihydrofolate reductase